MYKLPNMVKQIKQIRETMTKMLIMVRFSQSKSLDQCFLG